MGSRDLQGMVLTKVPYVQFVKAWTLALALTCGKSFSSPVAQKDAGSGTKQQ